MGEVGEGKRGGGGEARVGKGGGLVRVSSSAGGVGWAVHCSNGLQVHSSS